MDWYSDVFDIIFPALDTEAANSVWEKQLKEPEKEKKKRKTKSSSSSSSSKSDDEDSDDD